MKWGDMLKGAAIDLAGLTGLGLLSWGCNMIYEPLSFIVAGVCLIAYSVIAARRS